jgi:hypothetical protein
VYACLWESCGFESADSNEIVRHVNFHSYHTKINCIGSNILSRSRLPVSDEHPVCVCLTRLFFFFLTFGLCILLRVYQPNTFRWIWSNFQEAFCIYESLEDGHLSGPKHVVEVIHIKLQILLLTEAWKKCLTFIIVCLVLAQPHIKNILYWVCVERVLVYLSETNAFRYGFVYLLVLYILLFPCNRPTFSISYEVQGLVWSVHRTLHIHSWLENWTCTLWIILGSPSSPIRKCLLWSRCYCIYLVMFFELQ